MHPTARFRSAAALALLLALLTASLAPMGTTWAWFTANSTSQLTPMHSASFGVAVSCAAADGVPYTLDDPVTLPAGTYDFRLAPTGTASHGYCRITSDSGLDLVTEDLPNSDFSFTLVLSRETTLTFTPHWGIWAGSGDKILPSGSCVDELGVAWERTTSVPQNTPSEAQNPGVNDQNQGVNAQNQPAEFQESLEISSESLENTVPAPGEDAQIPTEIPELTAFTIQREMPNYYQNDYPDQRYGAGTVESSGCGITSLAMVATYLTGHDYYPDELARSFGGTAENNIQRLENAANALKLPWNRAENFDYTEAALKEGKIVIALMEGIQGNSIFTQSQHFVVLKSITEDGKFLVNDPNKLNYEKWDMKTGFEVGFERYQVVSGYIGGWIFDPAQVPEDPFIYEDPRQLDQNNYPTVDLTYEEQLLIAKVIWAEAQGECDDGQQAIAEVILNRYVSGKFGTSIESVIYAEGQFRSVPKLADATPWQAQFDALDRALYGTPVLPPTVYYFAAGPTNENVWGQIGGHIFCYEA